MPGPKLDPRVKHPSNQSTSTAGLAVVAIGGNSLIHGGRPSFESQYRTLRTSCDQIAELVRCGWSVVVTHGNGPQVGFILRRSELAAHVLPETPLDVCDANSQGCIGYALQQNLTNAFQRAGITRQAVSLITQVEVAADDAAFERPSKPIGDFFDAETAARRRAEGWQVVEDAGRGYRRVVPSPRPRRIVEEIEIGALLQAGVVVVAAGGGGIPVVLESNGRLRGVPAVIDKDSTSALLAQRLGADTLVICTAVDRVALHYGTPEQRSLDRVTVADAERYLAEGIHFAAGSMAPKVEAACSFLRAGGQRAVITSPDRLSDALAGTAGTTFLPSDHGSHDHTEVGYAHL